MDDERHPDSPEEPADVGPDDEEPFARPVDRFRTTTVGTIVAAGLLGLADALEGRPPRETVPIVQAAPTPPPLVPRRLELLLDPEHPERSMVFLPAAEEAPPADDPA